MRRLVHRPRRLRRSPALRNLVRETHLTIHDFVLPLFASEKLNERRSVASMPGVFQLPVKDVADEARRAEDLGLQAILLFGIPEHKDEQASGAHAENGVIQNALRAIKSKCPELVTITDVCLCEYMSHGHCGIVERRPKSAEILNDPSLKILAKTAVSHAAGFFGGSFSQPDSAAANASCSDSSARSNDPETRISPEIIRPYSSRNTFSSGSRIIQ